MEKIKNLLKHLETEQFGFLVMLVTAIVFVVCLCAWSFLSLVIATVPVAGFLFGAYCYSWKPESVNAAQDASLKKLQDAYETLCIHTIKNGEKDEAQIVLNKLKEVYPQAYDRVSLEYKKRYKGEPIAM